MGVMSGYSDGSVPQASLQYVFTLLLLNIGLFLFGYTVGVIGAMNDAGSQKARDFQASHRSSVVGRAAWDHTTV